MPPSMKFYKKRADAKASFTINPIEKMNEELRHGASSYHLETGAVSLAVTRAGGHLTAEFRLGDRTVRPYAVAPWEPHEIGAEFPVLLSHLRGDFFCLPFGPQENGPPHGETANGDWHEEGSSAGELRLKMDTEDTGCRVSKSVMIRDNDTALYLTHLVEGLRGRWSYGSHPILDLSNLDEGACRVSVSAFRWGSTYHGLFSNPENGEYQSLRQDARFDSLADVPMCDGGLADLTRHPARLGFDDLIMVASDQGEAPFAWTACRLDGYVWFSLKESRDFPATLFWMSNGGRHGAPWSGRHRKRLGLEEVRSYFCDDVEASRRDLLATENISTTREFDGAPVALRLIQAVVAVPEEFDVVAEILPGENEVVLISESGISVTTSLAWDFLKSS